MSFGIETHETNSKNVGQICAYQFYHVKCKQTIIQNVSLRFKTRILTNTATLFRLKMELESIYFFRIIDFFFTDGLLEILYTIVFPLRNNFYISDDLCSKCVNAHGLI